MPNYANYCVQGPAANKQAMKARREAMLERENRAAAREQRAEHCPEVALYRLEKARHDERHTDPLAEAKVAWAALLAAEVVAGRGGRKRKQMPSIVKDWEIR